MARYPAINIALRPELFKRLQKLSEKEKRSVTKQVEFILEQYLSTTNQEGMK